MKARLRGALMIVVLISSSGLTPAMADDDPWQPYRFLIGEWEGKGSGQMGGGMGFFSLRPELQGKILVRKGRQELPPVDGKATPPHEDLMIIHRAGGARDATAVYYDGEGHSIRYRASFSDDGRLLTFLSDVEPSTPRYRLSYAKWKAEEVRVKFEIAPPGRPGDFRVYFEGEVKRIRGESK